jgi:hypothetical protein
MCLLLLIFRCAQISPFFFSVVVVVVSRERGKNFFVRARERNSICENLLDA